MYKIYLIFIILIQLILLVNRVINVNGQFIPGPRVGQKAVLIGKKLYVIGGHNYYKEIDPLSDFFYYDFGLGLNNTELVDLRSQGINLPYETLHTANIGGANQDLIFIVGGVLEKQNTVHQFDTKTNTLTTPIIQGKMPPIRGIMNSVSYEGKIYMFGGYEPNNVIYNGFDILDTINLSWGIGNLEGASPASFAHTATLISEIIYYIGGTKLIGADRDNIPMENVCKIITKYLIVNTHCLIL
jgi:hypothetical protein